MLNNIIQNNLRPKPNYKTVYCSLKHMLEPMELQNTKTSTTFSRIGKDIEKVKVTYGDVKLYFFQN